MFFAYISAYVDKKRQGGVVLVLECSYWFKPMEDKRTEAQKADGVHVPQEQSLAQEKKARTLTSWMTLVAVIVIVAVVVLLYVTGIFSMNSVVRDGEPCPYEPTDCGFLANLSTEEELVGQIVGVSEGMLTVRSVADDGQVLREGDSHKVTFGVDVEVGIITEADDRIDGAQEEYIPVDSSVFEAGQFIYVEFKEGESTARAIFIIV